MMTLLPINAVVILKNALIKVFLILRNILQLIKERKKRTK